jgi:hypothetical protein
MKGIEESVYNNVWVLSKFIAEIMSLVSSLNIMGTDKVFIFFLGFYRVNYDENNWDLLINYLNSEDYEKIPPVNRAQLLDDALNLARAGILKYSTALELTQYLKKEVDFIPWYSALNAFSFLNLRLTGTENESVFKVK